MASFVYTNASMFAFDGVINWNDGNVKVALLTDSYTPLQGDDYTLIVLPQFEAVGTGYTAGGATLVNPILTIDNVNNKAVFDADDVLWTNATVSARYALVYYDGAISVLIALIDFGATKSSSGGDFRIIWNAGGIFTVNA